MLVRASRPERGGLGLAPPLVLETGCSVVVRGGIPDDPDSDPTRVAWQIRQREVFDRRCTWQPAVSLQGQRSQASVRGFGGPVRTPVIPGTSAIAAGLPSADRPERL